MSRLNALRRSVALVAMAVGMAVGVAGGSAMAASTRETTKLDAALAGIASQSGDRAALAAKRLAVRMQLPGSLVSTIVRYEGSLDGLEEHGAVVRSILGDIATVDIPADKIAAVAALPNIVYMEAARPVVSRLDKSVPATRADKLRVPAGYQKDWTAGAGKGVIVGVIDDGIDFRHMDFRKADGTSRILSLWDQRPTGAAGSPPTGYNYGGECTAQMINDAIAGNAGACKMPKSGGHGSHVGGIAAGNGQATGNAQPPYRMIGMAPDADLLVANSINDDVSSTSAVLDAVAYMRSKAKALQKPLVINMSLGSYYGSRDGTSAYERGLDNASGPGVIIVGAAGNEAKAKIRAMGSITQGASVEVLFNVFPYEDAADKINDGKLELWYPGTNSYAVKIAGPGGCGETAVVDPGAATKSFKVCDANVWITSTAPQESNGDRQILIELNDPNSKPPVLLRTGDWTLTLIGRAVAGGSSEFSIISGENGNGIEFASHTTLPTTQIVTDTASARRVIGVAAYNTRNQWYTTGGVLYTDKKVNALTDLADFSSRGPRRACSVPSKCPDVMKPEITAPGSQIVSAYGMDKAVTGDNANMLEADGVHIAMAGTSMATPHVAGAVALLLEKQPDLAPEQVKALLFANVQTNGYTKDLPTWDATRPDVPARPNYDWGYGILDIEKAVRSTPVPATNYQGLWWKAPADSESGWGVNFAHQGNTLFATWFTYDAAGKPWWLVSSLQRTAPGVYAGDVLTVTGPAFNSQPWDKGKVVETKVGTMNVAFSTTADGTLSYTVNGVAQTKPITKQVFGPLPTCVWGAQPDLSLAKNYQDLWWAAPPGSESGWGINFAHQGDTIFATWFTYDADGKPWWLVAVLRPAAGGAYTGDVSTVTGPSFDADPWDKSQVRETVVGTMSARFADGNHATLAYTVNGIAQTKSITREVWAPPGTVCQ